MSKIQKLVHQSSHYFIGRLLLLAAGMISFPILTRILSVQDYGILGLLTITILLLETFASLGSQDAIIRFFPEYETTSNTKILYSTVFYYYGGFGLAFSLIFLFIVNILEGSFESSYLRYLLYMAAAILFLNITISLISGFYRAQQKTKQFNYILVGKKYATLVFAVTLTIYFSRNLYSFYLGHILVGLLLLLILSVIFIKKNSINISFVSFKLFREMVRFGFPLSFSQLGYTFLSYSDRYLVNYFLGSVSLGIYTAGYNLSMYITNIIMFPISRAIDPIYLKIYTNEGYKNTSLFLSKTFRYFLCVLFPIVFGFIAVSKDLLIVLASEKYLPAVSVIPYIVIANAIFSCQVITNAGLFIHKKTHILMVINIFNCLLNLVLNLILIPKYGILGAAQSTLLCYILHTSFVTYFSFRQLSFRIQMGPILRYFLFAFVMYSVLTHIEISNHFYNILAKIPLGVLLYSTMLLTLDKSIRRYILHLIHRFIPQSTPSV